MVDNESHHDSGDLREEVDVQPFEPLQSIRSEVITLKLRPLGRNRGKYGAALTLS